MLSEQEISRMTLDDVSNDLALSVFQATSFLRELEDSGRIKTNARQIQNQICAYAVQLLEKSWDA